MIHGHLHSAEADRLLASYPVFKACLLWARNVKADAPNEIIELRGRELYANVHGYDTLPAAQCRWETHRETIDFQVCLSGGEVIDYAPGAQFEPNGAYDPKGEVEFWKDDGRKHSHLHFGPDEFAIFLPGTLHRPKVSDGRNSSIRKVVLKVSASLLNERGEIRL